MNRLHHFRFSAFARAVVHNGDARMERVYHHFRIRARLPVVQTQKDIDSAKTIVRTHQLEFLVPGQITQMNGAELSKGDVSPDGLRILGIVLAGLEIGAVWIRGAGAGQRRLDRLTSGRHDTNIETGHGNLVAWLRDRVFGLGIKERIRFLEKLIGSSGRLNVRTMIDEFANRRVGSELSQPAKVVAVPMRDNKMIDLLKAGIFD